MEGKRNPYLILGIPYGASRGEARRAAAKHTRAIRQNGQAAYSIEDVTWALYEIEQVIDDPDSEVDVYRVPASPGILDAPSGTGLFNPPAQPLPRRSGPLSKEEFDAIRHRAISAVSKQVLSAFGPHVKCWPPAHDEGRGDVHDQEHADADGAQG